MRPHKKLLWIFLCTIFLACGDDEDYTPPEEEDEEEVDERCNEIMSTLSENVIPIINTNCAISGCHVSGGQFPNLTVKENIISNASTIRNHTESGFMPAAESGLTLTASQKDDIFCWVQGGALDN